MSYYYGNRRNGFLANVPVVTKNILIINIIMFAATLICDKMYDNRMLESNIMGIFACYSPESSLFKVWQPITYMFMHSGFFHILFNMYTLLMFGSIVENILGTRKYIVFYVICGLGAAALHFLIAELIGDQNIPMVGASGAIYGVLIAYAMLFPQSRMTLIFPPVSLSAKWMVVIFAGIELLTGVTGTIEGVAHFAHLGGMLTGFLLIVFWRLTGVLFDKKRLL